MDEINAERRPLYGQTSASLMEAERDEVRRMAEAAINAPRAIGDELDELEATAAALLRLRNNLRAKADGLYTGTQVGDFQASEASLVSTPLRRELESVRRAWSAETVRREDAERRLAEAMAADHQNIVEQRELIKDLTAQRDRMAEAARRAQDTSSVLQDRVREMAGDIARLTDEMGRRYTLAQVMDQRAEAREEARKELEPTMALLITERDGARVQAEGYDRDRTTERDRADQAQAWLRRCLDVLGREVSPETLRELVQQIRKHLGGA